MFFKPKNVSIALWTHPKRCGHKAIIRCRNTPLRLRRLRQPVLPLPDGQQYVPVLRRILRRGDGVHYGVQVGDKIYDNLPFGGMLRNDWLADLGFGERHTVLSWSYVTKF